MNQRMCPGLAVGGLSPVFYNRSPPPEIFADGFETGDPSAWSAAVP